VNETPKERILDVCLEEVLGGHYPPDLTAKILQTWQARQAGIDGCVDAGRAAAPPVAASPPPFSLVPPPVQYAAAEFSPTADAAAPSPLVAPRRRRRRTSRVPWWWLAMATGALAAGVSLFVYVVQTNESAPDRPTARVEAGKSPPSDARVHDDGPVAIPARSPSAAGQVDRIAPARPAKPRPVPRPSPLAVAVDKHVPSPQPERRLRKPSPDQDIVAFVDDVLRQAWREYGVTPSPPVSESQWCQRAYSRLVGRDPTKNELDRYLKNKAADRRQTLVDQLLASDEYARYWADFWAATFLGPELRSRELADRDGLRDYLQAALQAGQPYDQLVQGLLSAEGSNRRDADNYSGAVNFLLAGAADHALATTDRTARAFLGQQLVCTQCHDDAAAGRGQSEFWQLNAFFRQMRVAREPGQRGATLTDADFPGESGAAKDAEIFYRLPDGRLKIAYPALNGQSIPHSGLLRDVHRRQELAKLVTASDYFPRAAVNRLWAHLLGFGFVEPTDDLGPHHPPSHPQLFERLSEELAAHEFDLRALTRWIVLSEPFGLSGRRMPESWMDAPEKGGQPLFARWYLPSEPVPDVHKALLVAVNSRPKAPRFGPGSLSLGAGTYVRVSSLSTQKPEIIEPQLADSAAGQSWLDRLAASPLKPERKIEHLFWSALGRSPTPRELTAAKLLLADRLNDAVALPEIWRTLLANGAAAITR
jgi:hypothetical protein